MLLAFTLELKSSAKHPKLHSNEVRRISFNRTLHQALSCSWLVDAVKTQSLKCPNRRKLDFRILYVPQPQWFHPAASLKPTGLAFHLAASLKQTGLATLVSYKAVWGKMTCDAPLSAIAIIGFMSLTGAKILAERNTVLPQASAAPWSESHLSMDEQLSGVAEVPQAWRSQWQDSRGTDAGALHGLFVEAGQSVPARCSLSMLV